MIRRLRHVTRDLLARDQDLLRTRDWHTKRDPVETGVVVGAQRTPAARTPRRCSAVQLATTRASVCETSTGGKPAARTERRCSAVQLATTLRSLTRAQVCLKRTLFP